MANAILLRRTGLVLIVALSAGLAGKEEDRNEITAVLATLHNGYQRTKLPDHTFKPETFAFGEGGFTGTPVKDKSVDAKSFRTVAQVLAPALARLNYVSSHDPAGTELLIMVYWGTTGTDQNASGGYNIGPAPMPPPLPPPPVISAGRGGVVVVQTPPPARPPANSPDQAAFDAMASAQNRQRDRDNARNAAMLGYEDVLTRASSRPEGRQYLDLVDEVEDTRYFVILRAYDFQQMWKEKKQKLLWEVRFSIRARDHLFDEALAAMTHQAARYFGQESKGLVRQEIPVGKVNLGDTIYHGVSEPAEPEKK